MARTPTEKTLHNTRLLKDYASWVYCTACQQTVAYLCYVTYDEVDLDYTCTCGSQGHVHIRFAREEATNPSATSLITVKNRLCCPQDQSPLLTIVEKNLQAAQVRVICRSCRTEYRHAYHRD